ncbi:PLASMODESMATA CALLOSE-BINDING PROTEIN 3-like [Solanum dulcamara]|uniref:PLASMODESMATA CALLOSE-BINDING PROTEIN 3-like n=1 Tax=Solanum dulcamara TaxID=45834 RepID=UPI0024864BDF|nr:PLASMODESMATA CALLOSE-BINDING PROTEIN 3-like [Solanum dulcamara]
MFMEVLIILVMMLTIIVRTKATWCIVRSDASNQALQRGLDYACSNGADCAPIQSNGLCYLPNTIQNHASYAFNSFYQRNNMAPGSCQFSGTATFAKTDPSYGSCVYPASPRSAGGPLPPGVGGRKNTSGGITTTPILNSPPQVIINPVYGNRTTPITVGSDDPNSLDSKATCPKFWTMASLIPTYLMFLIIHNFQLL